MEQAKLSLVLLIFSFLFMAAKSQSTSGGGECDPNLCQNCITEGGTCECTGRWTGEACNESLICDEEDPCNGGVCSTNAANEEGFECDCSNTTRGGARCNIETCDEFTSQNPYDNVITSFPLALSGEWVAANETCEGGDFDGKPSATSRCNITGSETIEWLNCTANLTDLEPEQQLKSIQIITSDPALTTADDVNAAIEVFETIAEQGIDNETEALTTLMACTNNLLLAESETAQTEVSEQSSNLLHYLNMIARSFQGASVYSNTETQFAMIIEATPAATPGTPAAQSIQLFAEGMGIGLDQPQPINDGFTGVQFNYIMSNIKDDQALYTIVISADDEVIYQAFFNDNLFEDQSVVPLETESLVMGVQSNSAAITHEMKFYLFKYYSSLNNMEYNSEDVSNKTFYCASWVNSTWQKESNCNISAISANETELYNYVTCTCQKSGYFKIASAVEQQQPPVNTETTPVVVGTTPVYSGLTDGEIAGIVIGSVAGALLIVGGGVYAVKKSKSKKKKKKSTPIQEYEQNLKF